MSKRILIVNVNWIGDVLFSTPFIRAVRKAHPDAYIACLLHPRCKDMLKANPRLDDIIVYDEEGVHRSIFGKARLVSALRKKHFNTAYILHRSFTKALMVYLAGIRDRIGYPAKKRGLLLTRIIDEPDEELHKVEYFLNIARQTGIPAEDVSYEFFVGPQDRKFIDDLLESEGVKPSDGVAVLCPGGNWDPKRWPKENFALLGDMLHERCGLAVVVSGAKKDLGLSESVKGMMKNPAAVTAGKTTLGQLGALLARARIVIANDSGPMHMAVAMKTKTIALFGPTDPRITGPYGAGDYKVISGVSGSRSEPCEVPCYDMTCTDNECMAAIKVTDVFDQANLMLG